jgi:hypothetical protein
MFLMADMVKTGYPSGQVEELKEQCANGAAAFTVDGDNVHITCK